MGRFQRKEKRVRNENYNDSHVLSMQNFVKFLREIFLQIKTEVC